MHPHPRLSSSQLVASALGNCGDPSGQSTNCLHSTSPNASYGRYMLYWSASRRRGAGGAAPLLGCPSIWSPPVSTNLTPRRRTAKARTQELVHEIPQPPHQKPQLLERGSTWWAHYPAHRICQLPPRTAGLLLRPGWSGRLSGKTQAHCARSAVVQPYSARDQKPGGLWTTYAGPHPAKRPPLTRSPQPRALVLSRVRMGVRGSKRSLHDRRWPDSYQRRAQ